MEKDREEQDEALAGAAGAVGVVVGAPAAAVVCTGKRPSTLCCARGKSRPPMTKPKKTLPPIADLRSLTGNPACFTDVRGCR